MRDPVYSPCFQPNRSSTQFRMPSSNCRDLMFLRHLLQTPIFEKQTSRRSMPHTLWIRGDCYRKNQASTLRQSFAPIIGIHATGTPEKGGDRREHQGHHFHGEGQLQLCRRAEDAASTFGSRYFHAEGSHRIARRASWPKHTPTHQPQTYGRSQRRVACVEDDAVSEWPKRKTRTDFGQTWR